MVSATHARAILLTGCLCASAIAQPANDRCADATPIACGDRVRVQTQDATRNDQIGCIEKTPAIYDLWFRIEGTGEHQQLRLDVGEGEFLLDLTMNVFKTGCDQLDQAADCVVSTQDINDPTVGWDTCVGISYLVQLEYFAVNDESLISAELSASCTPFETSDTDGDGVIDRCDQCRGDDATGDADADGVCDDLDVCPGVDDERYNTELCGCGHLLGPGQPTEQVIVGTVIDAAIADLDRDGRDDLVVTTTDDTGAGWIFTLISDGMGGFEVLGQTPLSAAPTSLAVLEINQDGVPDIAVTTPDGFTHTYLVSVFGRPSFAQSIPMPGQEPRIVDTGDFDGDGWHDLLASVRGTTPGEHHLQVLQNRTDGLLDPGMIFLARSNRETARFAALDIDRDGTTELAMIEIIVGIFEITPAMEFFWSTGRHIARSYQSLHAEDIDGDDDQDMLVFSADPRPGTDVIQPRLHLFRNNDGTFPVLGEGQPVDFTPSALHAVDFDVDGDQDLLLTDRTEDRFRFLVNHGDGAFASVPVELELENIRTIFATDVNGDHLPDLIALSEDGRIQVFLNESECVCPCDIDHSGELSIVDMLLFLDDWLTGANAGTDDWDGQISIIELLELLDCWLKNPACD